MEGGDSYCAHLVAKQLLKARSHVSKGQLFLGPPDFGGSPHTHTHLEVQLQCLLTRPTSPPCPHPTPPTRTGSSESESLPETWGAPSRASALPAAQLPGFLLGHPVPRALLGRSAPGHPLLSSLILTTAFAHSPPLCYVESFTQPEVPPRQDLGRSEMCPTCKLMSGSCQGSTDAGKDTKCLEHKQRMVYSSQQQQEPSVGIVVGQFPKLRAPQRARGHLRAPWWYSRRGASASGKLSLSWGLEGAVGMPGFTLEGQRGSVFPDCSLTLFHMASFQNSLPLGTCEHGNGLIWKYSLCRLNQVMMRSSSTGKVKVSVAQSCPTLGDPMDCSPPGFSVHGILQARTLEWVATPFSRGSS